METVLEETPKKSVIAAVLVFMIHQAVATAVVFLTTGLLFALGAGLLGPLGVRMQQSSAAILTGPPYFPLQIAWALFLGWSLSGYLQHRSMLWIWIIPTIVFCYVFIQFPASPVLFADRALLSSSSRLSHFLGRGCNPRQFCFDQLYITLPFYTATAYSLGAWWARKTSWLSLYAKAMTDLNLPRVFLVCAAYFCLEVGRDWRVLAHLGRMGPIWVEVVMGLWGLISFFAISTYMLMVLISLIGRRFAVTRWFLHENPHATVSKMHNPIRE